MLAMTSASIPQIPLPRQLQAAAQADLQGELEDVLPLGRCSPTGARLGKQKPGCKKQHSSKQLQLQEGAPTQQAKSPPAEAFEQTCTRLPEALTSLEACEKGTNPCTCPSRSMLTTHLLSVVPSLLMLPCIFKSPDLMKCINHRNVNATDCF